LTAKHLRDPVFGLLTDNQWNFFIFLLYWVDPQKWGEKTKKGLRSHFAFLFLFSLCLKRVIGDIAEDDSGLEDGGPKVIFLLSFFYFILTGLIYEDIEWVRRPDEREGAHHRYDEIDDVDVAKRALAALAKVLPLCCLFYVVISSFSARWGWFLR